MPRLSNTSPTYRRHKASGQAVVSLAGRDVYLGPYGTRSSRNEYDRVVGEWMVAGRATARDVPGLSVVELITAYWKHADRYYRTPDGSDSGELKPIKAALRPLKRLYGRTPAVDFGPLALKAVRDEMIRTGWCRTYINIQIGRIKRMFKWGVENEVMAADVLHALQAVSGLKSGRTSARETEPVRPVPDALVEATFQHASPHVRAMIRLQLLTGMRPGEVCGMRHCDLDRTSRVWAYRPPQHKTSHRGHARVVYLGPRAQEELRPFLKPDLSAHVFSPADAEAARREALRAVRQTPLSCGNSAGTNRKRRPERHPGPWYDVAAYRRAITRACDRAFPSAPGLTGEQVRQWRAAHRWHPHQLRHNAATALRKEFGLEAAQVILGHKTLAVTEIYAERNISAAQRIMEEVG